MSSRAPGKVAATSMGSYWLDAVIAAYIVLLVIAERQTTRRLVALAFGLPLVLVPWLTRKY